MAMKLTLYGLVRAMRWKAHGLAEEVEESYRPDARIDASRKLSRVRARATRDVREEGDDRPGR